MNYSVVKHQTITIRGIRTFYREAGNPGSPLLLLPHGYPCSSYQYRRLMIALADKWHVIAPDFPGFGYSDTPKDFDYSFDGYAAFLNEFVAAFAHDRFVLYLHDYGSQIGLRLAMMNPERIDGLIIQNGDIYEDVLGPKYNEMKHYWQNPTKAGRERLYDAVTEDGFRKEFIGEIDQALIAQMPPDLWKLTATQLLTPERRDIMVGLMEGLKQNLAWMPNAQAYLRQHRPPTLIVWGPQDGYMPEVSAKAYLRDLPDAELHFLEGGHWLLETHFDQVVSYVRPFLERLHE